MSLIQSSDRIAIFGGRGMAGSAIVRALVRKGYPNQLMPSRQDLNLLNGSAVEQWMVANQPDVVVLAAAKVGGILANSTYPADFLLENLKIQSNVIEAAWRHGARRLLFLGSSCIYPKFADQPIREEALLQGEFESTNEWYAIAKIAGVKLCDALRKQYGFDAISLMPTNLYGPGDNYHPQNSHVLPALIRRFHEAAQEDALSVTCWGSGSPLREFMHVDDLADACLFVLEHWSALQVDAPNDQSGERLGFLNVGTGIDCTIKELAEKVAYVTGFGGQILWDKSKPDGTPKKLLDVSRLHHMGWHSHICLEKGIRSTYQAYLKETESWK